MSQESTPPFRQPHTSRALNYVTLVDTGPAARMRWPRSGRARQWLPDRLLEIGDRLPRPSTTVRSDGPAARPDDTRIHVTTALENLIAVSSGNEYSKGRTTATPCAFRWITRNNDDHRRMLRRRHVREVVAQTSDGSIVEPDHAVGGAATCCDSLAEWTRVWHGRVPVFSQDSELRLKRLLCAKPLGARTAPR